MSVITLIIIYINCRWAKKTVIGSVCLSAISLFLFSVYFFIHFGAVFAIFCFIGNQNLSTNSNDCRNLGLLVANTL